VKIAMEAKTDTAKVTAGTFSVSVTDETKVPVNEPAEATILTDLLLTSELKGNINQPNYYFTNRTVETDACLDLLMLTQGYRSFEWKKILSADNPRVLYQPEAALSLSGTIKLPSGKPVPNGKVRLTSVKDLFVADTLTDLSGSFTFTNLELADSTKVVINAKKAKGGDNVKIVIKEPAYAAVDKTGGAAAGYPDPEPSEPVKAAMQQAYVTGQDNLKRYKVIQLKQVNIKSRRNDYFNPVYSDNMKLSANLNGPGNANEVILGDKLMRGGDGKLSDILRGKTFLISFSKGLPISNHLGGVMAVFIDGAQISANNLDDINANDIYSIEVLTSLSYLSIYGSNAPHGALIITLKHGADHSHDAEYNTVDGLVTYVFKGFYKARKFYAPKYDVKNNGAVTGDRKTIYWNPDVITDKNGRSAFEFYNAGSPGTYRVVVEGIDDNGNLGRQVFKYKVE
ncbi:MAG: carboxypeptidase-like regulatory domain-containing protein, partial [Bacteroidota bacterium]|nr:carboxypeptidase-like regulatory domain-containing protein [Bacteroidota bacterium]